MYNDFMLYDNSYTLIENNIEQLLFNIDYIPNSKQTTYVNNVEYNCVIVDNTFYDWKYNHVNKYDYTISKVSFVRNEEDLYKLTYSLLHKDYIYYVYETDKYFKLKNIDRYTTSCGWEELTKEEVDYLNNVVETNKGNNPHIGSYDDGETYLNNFKKFFNGYNFDSVIILDELLSTIHYGFNILRHSDTSKCSFYNSTNKKNYKTYCDLRNENILKPYNLFSNKKEEELSEIDSLSIINSKELHITFDTEYKDFIEEDVLPYIKQVIPATSLFSYSFENIEINGNNSFAAESYEVVCNANTTPVYAVDCV